MPIDKLEDGFSKALAGSGDWVEPLEKFVSTSKGLAPIRCTVKMFQKIQGMFRELYQDPAPDSDEVCSTSASACNALLFDSGSVRSHGRGPLLRLIPLLLFNLLRLADCLSPLKRATRLL